MSASRWLESVVLKIHGVRIGGTDEEGALEGLCWLHLRHLVLRSSEYEWLLVALHKRLWLLFISTFP